MNDTINFEAIALRQIDKTPLWKTLNKLGIRRSHEYEEHVVYESPFNQDKYGTPYYLDIDTDHNQFTEHVTLLQGRPIDFLTRYYQITEKEVVNRYLARAAREN